MGLGPGSAPRLGLVVTKWVRERETGARSVGIWLHLTAQPLSLCPPPKAQGAGSPTLQV